MKMRIPQVIFIAENYEDIKAYKALKEAELILNISVNFYMLNITNEHVEIETHVLESDTEAMLKIKREALRLLEKEIENLMGV